MKKAHKILALFMVLAMCVGFFPANVFASNTAGVTYTATLDNTTITPTAETQTVVMTVKTNKKVDIDALQMNVAIPSGWAMTSIANADLGMGNGDANLNTGAVVWYHPEGDSVNTDVVIAVTYTVPANVAVGTYELGVSNLKLFADWGTEWESGASASTTLTVAPAAADEEEPTELAYSAVLDKTEISSEAETQTVVMTVKANKKVDIDSLQTNVVIPTGWTMTSIANADLGMGNGDANLNTGAVVWYHPEGDSVNTDIIIEVTYTVPANVEAGTYVLGVENLDLFAEWGTQWEFDASASATLTVKGAAHTCTGTFTKGQAATCTADGWNDYYTCSCGKYYTDAACTNEIADLAAWKTGAGKIAGGHDYGTLIAAQPEVHTATELKAAVAAHYFCDACDTYFTEGKVATTLDALTGAVPTHNYATVNGYKGEDGHANTCACGAKDTVTGHTPNITAPTENDDQICSVCEYVIAPKLGHIHQNNLTKVPAQTADCENDGNIEYYTCSCGNWYEDATAAVEITDKESVKIPGGHDYGTLIAAQPEVHTATELKAAVAAHYLCDQCDTYFTEAKVATTLDALTGAVPTHNYATVNGYKGEDGHANTCACGAKDTVTAHTPNITAPTENDDQVCTVCEYVIAPKLGHIHQNNLTKVPAQTADCENDGNIEYYTCSCDKWFADATATTEITDKESVKIAGGHDYGTLIAAEPEVHTITELKAGVAAHYFCDACDTYFTEGKVATTLDALTGAVPTHNYATVNGYKGEDGHADTCSCGAKNTVVEHTPNIAAPTEDDDQVCTVCEYVIAPKLGHIHQNNLTKVPAQTADCENDGNIEYYTCSCGKWFADATASVEITDKESVKVAGGHDYGTLIAAEPEVHTTTELKAGVAAHYYCDECDTYFTEGKVATTLDALTGAVPTHNYATVNGYKGEDGHANTCACGAKDTVTAHTPDREEATEEHAILCAECGYEIAPVLPHTHNHGTEWKSDKKNHWNECACGDKANTAGHTDTDSNNICDVCLRDVTPSVTPETGDNNLVLWISLLLVSVLGVVTTVVGKKRFSVK